MPVWLAAIPYGKNVMTTNCKTKQNKTHKLQRHIDCLFCPPLPTMLGTQNWKWINIMGSASMHLTSYSPEPLEAGEEKESGGGGDEGWCFWI